MYIYKLPKKHINNLLNKMDNRLEEDIFKIITDRDGKLAVHKLFYRALVISPGDRIGAQSRDIFDKMAMERHEQLGNQLLTLSWPQKPDESMDWSSQGFFELQPKAPAGLGDPSSHTYQKILDKVTKQVVELPSCINVDATWVLEANWCYKDCTLATPRLVKPAYKHKALEFFVAAIPNYAEQSVFPKPMEILEGPGHGAGNAGDQGASKDDDDKGASNKKKQKRAADSGKFCSDNMMMDSTGLPVRQTLSQQEFRSKLARLHKAAAAAKL